MQTQTRTASDSRQPAAGLASSSSSLELSFGDRVAVLCQGAGMRGLAIRYARDHDLAEDALQETFYAVARVSDPSRIDDLARYVRRVLQRKVVELLESPCAHLSDDLDALIAASSGGVRRPNTKRPVVMGSPVQDLAVRRAQAKAWIGRLSRLSKTSVPRRSADPERYQRVIATVARRVLPAMLEGEVSSADLDHFLIAAYPEWFASRQSSTSTRDQRLCRGRREVSGLLESVVSRDELLA